MKSVTYFPPYTQEENIVTNAVLLLLSHVNRLAPKMLGNYISELLDDENFAYLGPMFFNQVTKKGGKSIVDAIIRQRPFEINIETKLGDHLNKGQIEEHLQGMKREDYAGSAVLLSITRSPLDKKTLTDFRIYGEKLGILVAAITFDQITSYFEENIENFHIELKQVVSDFRTFLNERGLVPVSENRLLINPCGTSLSMNEKYGIYHDQPERSKVYCKYLGCYHDKAVRLIGKLQAVFIGDFHQGELQVVEQFELPWQKAQHQITSNEKQRITKMANEPNYYDLKAEPGRFYLVDEFHKTNYIKTSKYGIQGHRYFTLDGQEGVCPQLFEGGEPSAKLLAMTLKDKSWA